MLINRCDYHLVFTANCFCGRRHGRVPGKTADASRGDAKRDLAGIEKSLTALKCLDRIWQLANFRL